MKSLITQQMSVGAPRSRPRTPDQMEGSGAAVMAGGSLARRPDEPLLTTGQAAALIGVKRKRVEGWVAREKILFWREGKGGWARIPLSAVEVKAQELQLVARWEEFQQQLAELRAAHADEQQTADDSNAV